MTSDRQVTLATMLNKVPQVTLAFWVIKVLATTVGETGADYLAVHVGLGTLATNTIMLALLLASLVAQFAAREYIPWRYWLVMVLISVVGTQITDFLTDTLDISLYVSTAVFAVALAITFAIWYAVERTLSIHSIFTHRREAFYWLAILFTFALGTAAGDLATEALGMGFPDRRAGVRGPDRRHLRRLPARCRRGAHLLDCLHPDPPARGVAR